MQQLKPFNSLLDLQNRSAIVTGGAKGIGYGIAYRLAEAGASVLIADIDEQAAKQAADELSAKGWKVFGLGVDVSYEDAIKNMLLVCQEQFGPVSIIVNNAGIYPPAPIVNMTVEQFDKVLATNLRSVFISTKYASEVMKVNGGGKIINITSIDALHPSMVGLAHYDASKHGAWGFTKNSALELAKYNIQVNAIAPGGITTPGVAAMSKDAPADQLVASQQAFMAKIPMHRMGEPDEIGTVALFLASDMSSYITGSQIVVDGGALLS